MNPKPERPKEPKSTSFTRRAGEVVWSKKKLFFNQTIFLRGPWQVTRRSIGNNSKDGLVNNITLLTKTCFWLSPKFADPDGKLLKVKKVEIWLWRIMKNKPNLDVFPQNYCNRYFKVWIKIHKNNLKSSKVALHV